MFFKLFIKKDKLNRELLPNLYIKSEIKLMSIVFVLSLIDIELLTSLRTSLFLKVQEDGVYSEYEQRKFINQAL